MESKIRPYHPSDLYALYQICLKTGDSGKDATHKYKNPEILGHFYAAPYAVFESDLCFVMTCSGSPCGYILGTRDSAAFYERCERDWFPVLRERYPKPADDDTSADANIIRLIHRGHTVPEELRGYPAHLHIDILPVGQGQGMGRKLTDTFLNRLRELNVPAIHLQVGKANPGAIKFYERIGFHVIREYERAIAYGMKLS